MAPITSFPVNFSTSGTVVCNRCNVKYREADRSLHQTVCLALQGPGERPSNSHRRVIYFSPGHNEPQFIWVDGRDGSTFDIPDLPVCACTFPAYSKEEFNFWLFDRSSAPIVMMWYEQSDQEKVEPSQMIYNISGERFHPHHSIGPLFAMGYEIRDGTRVPVDINMQRIRIHLDFLKTRMENKKVIATKGFDPVDMVDAMIVLCQGEYKHNNSPFKPVKVHQNHAVFKQRDSSPLLNSLGTKFSSMKLPTPDLGDDYLLNLPATMMHMSCDPDQVDVADQKWLGKVGNVIVVFDTWGSFERSTALELLCLWCVQDLSQCYLIAFRNAAIEDDSSFENA